jgi:phytoene dehydrogenase-like protein
MDTMTTVDQANIVIVGGGLAGLAAACYLGRAGRSVALFEKASVLGGRGRSQDRDGYIMNIGAHAVYEKSAAAEVLRELGVRFTSGSPQGICSALGGKLYEAPVGPLSLLRTGLLDRAEKWEAAGALLDLTRLDPAEVANVTLAEWLDRKTQRPRVRKLIEASVRTATYTNAPDQLSMAVAVEQTRQAMGTIHYVDGGWQTLVDGLANTARSTGVRLVTGVGATSVERIEDGYTVRLDNGTTYRAASVVLALPPRDASRLVDGGHNTTLGRWAEADVPVKAAILDLGLRRLPRPDNRVVMDLDRPLFLTVQSEFSKVAPAGRTLLYAIKYKRPGEPSDAEADRKMLEEWLDLTQPGWREEVEQRSYLPDMTIYHGLASVAQGGTAERPAPEVPGTPGLYVAGDWVGPRGILAAASLWSARLAAGLALQTPSRRLEAAAAA